jgi:hypothetical protein
MRLLWVLLAVASFGLPRIARAQSPADLLARAIRAYRGLEYDAAATQLRRALAEPAGDSLPRSDRARALSYLAASDYYRGRRDSAAAVYRRLVLFDPSYRPDPLVFPPDVTSLHEAVRRVTKTVAVAAADTVFRPADERWAVRLYASSFHTILVTLVTEDGRTLRTLYAGPIGDSLDVRWDGLDETGRDFLSGRMLLTVTSLTGAGGDALRVVQVPMDVRAARPDTLPMPPPPPDSLLRPERTPTGPALRSFGGGLLGGVVVMSLPSLVAGGMRPSGSRVAVAAAISLTGIVGYFTQRPGRPIPENMRANRATRAAWQVRAQDVARENADRRRNVRLTVRVQRPLQIEREGP